MDGLTLAGTLGLGEDAEAARFFKNGEKCEKTVTRLIQDFKKYQLESAKKRMNFVQGENLEDQKFALHDQELECRRFAP